jgi:hypothetical protein
MAGSLSDAKIASPINFHLTKKEEKRLVNCVARGGPFCLPACDSGACRHFRDGISSYYKCIRYPGHYR